MASVTLDHLDRLVGSWTTEATHRLMPGVVVHGEANIEWLEGRRFLIIRAKTDHDKFPDSIVIIGFTNADSAEDVAASEQLKLHYYDSRGVFRDYEAAIDDKEWRYWRDGGFPQRFTGTFTDGGATIVGMSQLREDGGPWKDDLAITYRRR